MGKCISFRYTCVMPQIICKICDKSFYCKPNRLKKDWGKYCSNECKHKGFYSGQFVNCTQCNTKIYKTLTDLKRSLSGKFFCNKSCQTKWRNSQIFIGSKHANWINGQGSYRNILLRENRNLVCEKCNTRDIRILAVHHKDKDHQNNDPSNLIWLCHNCHFLVHHYANEAVGYLD